MEDAEFCSCCGNQLKKEPFRFSDKYIDFYILGVGIPLYFNFLINVIILLIVSELLLKLIS